MLQHWVNKGEFYIGGFELRKFLEPVTFARCVFYTIFFLMHALHKKKYHIGRIFRYTYIHIETFRTFTLCGGSGCVIV